MKITEEHISHYLADVFTAINAHRYQISAREKNLELYIDYIFTEQDAKEVLLSLTIQDFSDTVCNEHPKFADEILYIFGKEIELISRYSGKKESVALYIKINKLDDQYVIVVSLHKQEHPLSYKFK